jgi:two-component system C4-dicarboxylate transport sensor histidine kinase DctB
MHKIPRALVVVLFLALVSGLGAFVWRSGYAQALTQLSARGQADLALASDRLVAELQRYRSIAVLLADHPALTTLGADPETRTQAEALLLESADKTGALEIFYADARGQVLASALGAYPEDVFDSPWFQRALDGALGLDHGLHAPFGRVFYYATPSFGRDGKIQGVVTLVVPIDTVEEEWRGARPAMLFRDQAGQVFVTNRSELLFWNRDAQGLSSPDGTQHPLTPQWVAGHEIWHQRFSPYIPSAALHIVQPLPVIGMTGDALVDAAPARRLAALQAAVVVALCLVFGLMLFVATERRRTLAQANQDLEHRVGARTQDLETANAALRYEITERQEAETALRRAQQDLVQAGKLSALGQMSAGISHELNQPLMAIRQFAENGSAFLHRGKPEKAQDNLARIASLSQRAARIIKNLRSFARNENEPMGQVDLVAVIDQAVELTETRLKSDAVQLDWQPLETPVFAKGGEVRLTQVFVNLINNAADAMAGQDQKQITLRLTPGQVSDEAPSQPPSQPHCVTVQDTGPGIEDPERVFEPFYSTKEVGEGMGLGLSISYGLVQSFGGQIRGANTEQGARFSVELDPWSKES